MPRAMLSFCSAISVAESNWLAQLSSLGSLSEALITAAELGFPGPHSDTAKKQQEKHSLKLDRSFIQIHMRTNA